MMIRLGVWVCGLSVLCWGGFGAPSAQAQEVSIDGEAFEAAAFEAALEEGAVDEELLDEAPPVYASVPQVMDPEAQPVVVLDRMPAGIEDARASESPLLLIYEDGRVSMGSPYGVLAAAEARMSRGEVQELVGFFRNEIGFGQIDGEAVSQAIRDAGDRAVQESDRGAIISRLWVRDGDAFNEVVCPAVRINRKALAEVDALQKLDTAERALDLLMSRVYAGGYLGVARHLEILNTVLRLEHGISQDFVAEDLASAQKLRSGVLQIEFKRVTPQDDGAYELLLGTIEYPDENTPKTSVQRVTGVQADQL